MSPATRSSSTSKGRLRETGTSPRLRPVVIDGHRAGESPAQVRNSCYDFGAQPPPTPPPAGEVRTGSQRLASWMGRLAQRRQPCHRRLRGPLTALLPSDRKSTRLNSSHLGI